MASSPVTAFDRDMQHAIGRHRERISTTLATSLDLARRVLTVVVHVVAVVGRVITGGIAVYVGVGVVLYAILLPLCAAYYVAVVGMCLTQPALPIPTPTPP